MADDLSSQWKSLTPTQRDEALGRMTPVQKQQLASALGYKGEEQYATPDTRNSIQKTFDTNTQINPEDSLVQRALKSATAAVGSPFIHPIKTVEGLPNSFLLPTPEYLKEISESPNKKTLAQGVAEGLGSFAGSLLLGGAAEGVGEVVGPMTRSLKATAKAPIDAIAGTGTGATKALVRETQAGNVAAVENASTANANAARTHFDQTIDALHKTQGNELQHSHAVKAATDAAGEAQKALDAEHAEAVQDALQKTREAEDMHQGELRKAKAESEDAYQKKLADVEKQRATAQESRNKELRQYAEKKAKVQRDFEDAQAKYKSDFAKQAKIAPTATKLKDASSELRGRVETARENALKEGNVKYNTVNEKLNPLSADMEKVHSLYQDASDVIGDTQNTPAILKRVGTALKDGEALTYKDLQGAYSELGKELSKGNLPGPTYHAYDILHDGIGEDMQRIADSQGQGAQLLDARNYWRRMKQTFGKPLTMADNATAAVKGANADFVPEDVQANRIRLLGSFDPQLPGLFEHIQNLQKGAESLPKPVPARTLKAKLADARKPVPSLPERPEDVPNPEPVTPRDIPAPARVEAPDRPGLVEPNLPSPPERVAPEDRPPEVVPETKTIGSGDVRSAKAEALQKRADTIRNRGGGTATAIAALGAIRDVLTGNMGGLAETVAARTAFSLGKSAIANLLENPSVVKFLTEPTAADIAQIPPELRGNIGKIAEAAKTAGINVNPALTAAVAVSGPQTQKLRELQNAHQQTASQ